MDNFTLGLIIIAVGAAVTYGSNFILGINKKEPSRKAVITVKSLGLCIVILGTLAIFGVLKFG